MKYNVGDWIYIDYYGDRPPFPYKIINVDGYGRITITVHKKYKSITGWGNVTNSWLIEAHNVIKKCNKGLELE